VGWVAKLVGGGIFYGYGRLSCWEIAKLGGWVAQLVMMGG
jgi:hypothetical protein